MSMEEIVKKRHELEDRVKYFLTQVDRCVSRIKTMETRDIEICMARLYDLMMEAKDEATRLDNLFKGLLVKSVYDKRKSGDKKKLALLQGSAWLEDIINYEFEYPVPITETLANEWGHGGEPSVRNLLTT